jgi:DNA replication and repair protein RecF
MRILGLWLKSFRNYQDKTVNFLRDITVLVGENGKGKTSILEGIFLASTGESFRAGKIEEMINFESEFGRVQVKAEDDLHQQSELITPEDSFTIEVFISTGLILGKKTQKRAFSFNGVRRLKKDVVGKLLVVVFRPEDLRLIEGSKARRRSYLDVPLSLVDARYAQALKNYEHILRRRNKILEKIRDHQAEEMALAYWDQNLLKLGELIQQKRAEYISFLSKVAFPQDFTCTYLPSTLNLQRLQQYHSKSILAGHTLIGPHKDDFMIELKGNDVAKFGSRGQQRLAVLWLKVCERAFLQNTTNLLPVLLLDDIFSELDSNSQALIFSQMKQGQAIITTADSLVAQKIKAHYQETEVINLNNED